MLPSIKSIKSIGNLRDNKSSFNKKINLSHQSGSKNFRRSVNSSTIKNVRKRDNMNMSLN